MKIPRIEEFMRNLQKSWEYTAHVIEEAQKNMKWQFDKKRRNSQGLKAGDHVWLENKISSQIDPQRSWITKDIDPLESQRTLVQECFN